MKPRLAHRPDAVVSFPTRSAGRTAFFRGRGWKLLALLALVAGWSAARPARGAIVAERERLTYLSDEIQTPHIPWGKPLAGGKVKLLALVTGIDTIRQLVELQQRFDFEIATSLYVAGDYTRWLYAVGDFPIHQQLMKQQFNDLLAEDRKYDAILLAGNAWDYLTDESRQQLAKLVAGGVGLVWIGPCPSSPDGWNLLPVDSRKPAQRVPVTEVESHPLLQGLALPVLPALSVRSYEMKSELEMERDLVGTEQPPLLFSSQHGKGKVVLLGYDCDVPVAGASGYSYDCGLLPYASVASKTAPEFPWQEQIYSLIGKAVLNVTGRKPAATLQAVNIPKPVAAQSDASLSVQIKSDDAGEASLTLIVQDGRGRMLAPVRQQVQLTKGKTSTVSLPLPRLLPGVHVANVLLTDAVGVMDWFSVPLPVDGKLRIAQVTLGQRLLSRDQPLPVTVRLSAAPAAAVEVQFVVRDGYQRELLRLTAPATAASISQQLPLTRALGVHGRVEVSLLQSGAPAAAEAVSAPPAADLAASSAAGEAEAEPAVLDRQSVRFFMAAPRQWDDFEVMMWGGGESEVFAQYRRMGVTMVVVNDYVANDELMAPMLENNLKLCTRIGGYGKGGLLLPENSDTQARTQARESAAKWAPFGPLVSMAGDESFASATDRKKSQMSREVLAGFQKWLKERYGEVTKLNAAWQSQFADWETVEPVAASQLRGRTGNFAAYADLLEFVEYCFAYRYRCIQEGMSQSDPLGLNSASGTQSAFAAPCYDWWVLCTGGSFRSMLGYGTGDQLRMQQSFARMPQMLWSGYGRAGDRLTSAIVQVMWLGADGVGIFSGNLLLNPDYSFNNASRGLKAAADIVRGGQGKLLSHSDYRFDPVYVHYSQPSIRAAAALDILPQMGQAVEGVAANLLQGAGIESRYVSYVQVEKGELNPQTAPLLLMLHSLALSPKEAQGIRQYVAAGGIVLADVLPGVMDEQARTLAKGQLDDLFGITRKLPVPSKDGDQAAGGNSGVGGKFKAGGKAKASGEEEKPLVAELIQSPDQPLQGNDLDLAVPGGIAQPELDLTDPKTELTIGLPAEFLAPELRRFALGTKGTVAVGAVVPSTKSAEGLELTLTAQMLLTAVDVDVTLAGATALGQEKSTGAPLWLVHRYEKGLAILVNSDMLTCAAFPPGPRLQPEEAYPRAQQGVALMQAVLQRAGIKPEMLLVDAKGQGVATQRQFSHRQGDNLYFRPANLPAWLGPLAVQLAKKAHVYDMAGGVYLGLLDRVPIPEKPALAMGFAALPYAVRGLKLDGPGKLPAGGDADLTVTIQVDDAAAAGQHVVHLELLDPQGQHVACYDQNLLCPQGKGQARLGFALNDARGEWTIRARDAASGAKAEAKLTVE